MTMRNEAVASAWLNGNQAQSNRMWTDGKNLFSYGLKIGYTTKHGSKILYLYASDGGKGVFRSQTTSCHVSVSMYYAHVVIHPVTRKRIYEYTLIPESLDEEPETEPYYKIR